MFSPRLPLVVASSLGLAASSFAAVEVKELDGKVRVEIDGQLFTEYCYKGAPHVYYHPVIGPGGAKMTRSWPMAEAEGEERDHPHHRSMWFSHGDVNGFDFWAENKPGAKPREKIGTIEHEKLLEAKGGEKEGVVSAKLKWVAPDGSIPVTSVQTLRVHDTKEDERVCDIEVTLTAGEKDVVFGDTKEGTMGIRIAESMRLKQPKNHPPGEGHIVNSEGVKDGATWGKKAKWVDYSGPVGGKTLGIGMFDHPKNPTHPTRWHVRDYGLFAANPFCGREMDKSPEKGAAAYKLPAGQSVTFRYRLFIHEGDAEAAKVADRYSEYAASAK
ncbi:MAG: PmoA family protein [Chthoniobacteraceae bacterium]